jgi:peroxiredoxin
MSVPPRRGSRPRSTSGQSTLKTIGRMDAEFYLPLRDWMASIDFSVSALKAGDRAPNFFLPDENARLVSLASLLAQGPVILDFLCGSWSSFCLSKLSALIAALRQQPATIVAITAETGRYPRAMKSQNEFACLVLCDVDYGVELKFGLINAIPPKIAAQMAARGLDLADMHGVTKPMLTAPAVYVIAPSGKIVYAKVDVDYLAPPDTDSVLEALAWA